MRARLHTEENGVHCDFVHVAMPRAENYHNGSDSNSCYHSGCWRLVESIDTVENCRSGNEHGEIITYSQ